MFEVTCQTIPPAFIAGDCSVVDSRTNETAVSVVTLEWPPGPVSAAITESEVDIWRVDLSGETPDLVLATDELNRAARFHFEADRKRFNTARASLRIVLSHYLNVGPETFEFQEAAYGKPFLANPRETNLRFNLSHSRDVALIAVSRGREVGVDVEFMRPDFATEEVARHFFSQVEVAELAQVAPGLRTNAFFNCWTRKEAYIKARGEGLSLQLDSFDVSLNPGVPAAVLASRFDPADTTRWTMHELSPMSGYAAAIAIERKPAPVTIRHYSFSHDLR